MKQQELSHIDSNGNVQMVDTGEKPTTRRVAIAQAIVYLSAETMSLLQRNALPKGDALSCAKIGGIMAAKRTSELIPLCHNVPLNFIDVRFETDISSASIRIIAEARCAERTGVEMEAIVAAQCAATIIYDMCKAVQRDIVIGDIKLLYKAGGRSGEFKARELSDACS